MKTPKQKRDPDEVVKCGCGLPMRSRDWAEHWISCRVSCSVPVDAQDIANLEANEARLKEKRP